MTGCHSLEDEMEIVMIVLTVGIVFGGLCILVVVSLFAIWLMGYFGTKENRKRWNETYNPPSFPRDVMLVVDGEERRGWCGFSGTWFAYSSKSHDQMDAVRCYPTAWRELSRSERIAK